LVLDPRQRLAGLEGQVYSALLLRGQAGLDVADGFGDFLQRF
jgi:hypothetical protein